VVKDPLGREVERYVLDAADRVVAVTNLEGQSLAVTYGVLDMVKSLKRFDSSQVGFGYDGWGRLTNAAYPGGSMNFGYLSNGLPSFAANEAGVVSNVFDVANRLVGVKQCAPGGSLSYAYYPAGNVARVESVAGVSTYTNDNLERVSVIGSAVGQFTFGYNAWNGMVETITYPNGMTARYGYDEMDRATNIVFRDGQGNLVRSQALGFDAVGMITTNRLSDGNGLLEDRRYGYDGLDRLSGETVLDATGGVTRSASWNYDLAGNRLSQIADGSNTTYTCTQANRLTAWTGGSAAFDAAGCVTNLQYPDGRTLSLSWNARYQLTAVATNGGQAESYGHDALGRRVWTASAGVTNFFVYDGAQVVADVDAAGNMLRSYVWGPGIDNLLSMTTYGGTTSTYYAIKDHLGSVLALVDGTGAVAESSRYDAWGRVLEVRDAAGLLSFVGGQWSSPLGNRYLWQGREYSWPTGLYNFRARWCDPVTGRWLSNDPIGISGGLNQYVFCANNPVNFVDPFGENIWTTTWRIFKQTGQLVRQVSGRGKAGTLREIETGLKEAGQGAVVETQTDAASKALAKQLGNGKFRGPEKSPGYPEHIHPEGGPFDGTHIQTKTLTIGGIITGALIPRSSEAAKKPCPDENEIVGAAAWDIASGIDPFFITDALEYIFKF
jgi:RHS repeat-associated protein